MKSPVGSLFVGSPLVPGLLAVLFVLGSCTVIRPGQVGMKQQLGVLSEIADKLDFVFHSCYNC